MHNGQVREVVVKLSHSGRFRKIILALVTAIFLLGLLMAPVEQGATGVRIQNAGDWLWFAITTVTGVGYGDMVPVTALGRIVAAVLQVFGVVLFGAVMAFVSVELLRYQEDFNMRRLLERIDEQSAKIEELKKEIMALLESH